MRVAYTIREELQTRNAQNKLALWAGRISECRNSGQNVKDWCKENDLASLTVCCAPCDEGMYQALGFETRLGSTFAHID